MSPEKPLSRRAILITGGAKRIGKATAIELARRGARLAIHANSSIEEAKLLADRLATDHEIETLAFQADLSDASSAEELISKVVEEFGCIDGLVNSAAIWPKQPFKEMTAEDIQTCFNINTVAPMMLAKLAGLQMADQATGGVVITLGDAATAHDGTPYTGYAAYHPSKAAIPGMTRALAAELSEINPLVRVNAVLPGPVICEHLPNEPEESEDRKQHTRDMALVQTPEPGGYGRAEHVAHAVAFLVENGFMNAVCLPVDGGGRLK